MSEDLERLRAQIDALDDELLKLLSERARIVESVRHVKKGVAYRPEREAQILRRMVEANPGPLTADSVAHLYREIISACMALECPLRIAYLGPEGTFSESAARKQFGGSPAMTPCATIDEVFRLVEAGTVDYGVVPVENSTEGAIGRTLDLLLTSPLMICGEVNLRIHQNLLSKAGSAEGLEKVYSHAQSLAQCHEWLNAHLPAVPRVPVSSNAEAARLAAADPGSAAIAGEAAARLYELGTLAANIKDDPNNTTRFLVLATHDANPSGRDKTSLVCSAQNRPGAVHDLLAPLANHGVSMTKFESRPARGLGGSRWEYVFFIDVEGHRQEPKIAAALEELSDRAGFVKNLGAYPVALND